MESFISEDDIEQSLLKRLHDLKWDRIECDPAVEQQDEVATVSPPSWAPSTPTMSFSLSGFG